MNNDLYSVANYRLALKVSDGIMRDYLLSNPSWTPFDTLSDELSLLPNEYLKDRYSRCRKFMYKCHSLMESSNKALLPLKAYLYRTQFN